MKYNEIFKALFEEGKGLSINTIIEQFEKGVAVEKAEQLTGLSHEFGHKTDSLRYFLYDERYDRFMEDKLARGANMARDYIYFREVQ